MTHFQTSGTEHFHTITDFASGLVALDAMPGERICQRADESPRRLAQRVAAMPGVEMVVVEAEGKYGGSGILGGLSLVEELLLWCAEGVVPVALSLLGAGRIRDLSRANGVSSSAEERFFQRLARARCQWAEVALIGIPDTREAIGARIAAAREWALGAGEQLARWRRLVAADYLEEENRLLRHSLGHSDGPRGVARLALGALSHTACAITREKCANLLSEPAGDKAAQLRTTLLGPDYTRLLELAGGHDHQEPPTTKPFLPALEVLLVEDDPAAGQVWSQGLQELLPALRQGDAALCGRAHVSAVAPNDVAGLQEPDLVFLDLDLSGTSSRVEEVLASLKSRWPACPVVAFTRSDRAQIAEWCLSSGATAFFVKEPADDRERRSGQHFSRLADLMLSIDGVNGTYRGLWSRKHPVRRAHRELRQLLPSISRWDEILALNGRGAIVPRLAAAFSALLSPGADFYVTAETPAPNHSEDEPRWKDVCRSLLWAEELLLAALWHQAGETPPSPRTHSQQDAAPEAQWARARSAGYAHIGAKQLARLQRRGAFEARLGHVAGQRSIIDFETHVLNTLERTMLALRVTADGYRGDAASGQQRLQLRPAPAPLVAAVRHDITSRLGAAELVRSLLPEAPPQKEAADLVPRCRELSAQQAGRDLGDGGALREVRVWLVDDEPDGQYPQCLRYLLQAAGATVDVLGYSGGSGAIEGTAQDPERRPDLVLLDLNMPDADTDIVSPRGGLQAICRVRRSVSRAVPLAILTGSTDSLHMGQCIAAGAQDYIPKRSPVSDPVEGRRVLFDRLGRLAAFSKWVLPLREVVEDVDEPGGLEDLRFALLEIQCEQWPEAVARWLQPWGSPPVGDTPGNALDGAMTAATAAWDAFYLACLCAAPADKRSMHRPDEWQAAALLPTDRPEGSAWPHIRRGMVALGNVYEPVLALLMAGAGRGDGPARSPSLGQMLQPALTRTRSYKTRLARAGETDLAARFGNWLQKAEEARLRRNAWEHGSETAKDRRRVAGPAACAALVRDNLQAAVGLARAGWALCR